MKKILILVCVIINTVNCFAQKSASKEDWQVRFFKAESITLPILIDAAIKNSVQIEKLEANRQTVGEQLKLTKKQIFSGIGFSSGYSYGTRFNVAGGGVDYQPVYSFNAFSLPAQATYSVGVNMNLSLLQVIGRKHNIRQNQIALKQVDLDEKVQERELRAETINLYKQLVLARTIMLHTQDALQSAKVSQAIAEKRFRDGELQIDEQISATNYYNEAVLAFERSKSSYETTLLMMEELIGMSVKDLMELK